jgi:hypothetical protein
MRAVCWKTQTRVQVETIPEPVILNLRDATITAAAEDAPLVAAIAKYRHFPRTPTRHACKWHARQSLLTRRRFDHG